MYNLGFPWKINEHLAVRRGLSYIAIQHVEALHIKKRGLLRGVSMTRKMTPADFRKAAASLTEIEFDLQRAWGYPCEEQFHQFWHMPKCLCPANYNDKRFEHLLASQSWIQGKPYIPHYAISHECPAHGWPDFQSWWETLGLSV